MPVNHYEFDDQIDHGRKLRRTLQQLEESHKALPDVLDIMAVMIDGDGSDAAQFSYLTEKFGFPDNATARAAWLDLQTLQSKFAGNTSVTNVRAALLAAYARFG